MTGDQAPLEIEVGSGNVFADLGLDDAPELKLKAAIVGQINSILHHRHLTQVQASELLGLPQPKISALRNGKLHGFALEKLLEIMMKLDRDVEIGFSKSSRKEGSRYYIRNEKMRTPVAA
ncbi:helix-turn-helix transcriptional regulator [Limimaricola sp. G21655-S1]|uniref:helix-turn-helix domain-containing protein n=1 Tax=Limimaricola sp. G21655-S1 TaxID=3014768 RepID=UPI0022AFD8AA|nr:helix-turn-helix transcriptional regulator [Limimaricola sp. G21655-S1]MCZ4260872.1 helix-turn-helix transcriptional regulator [Limimaricola sp. G21655-S1]